MLLQLNKTYIYIYKTRAGMRLAIVKKGEAPNPTGSKTHISSTLPPAPRTRHFCNSRNPGAGRNATRTSTAHQPCKGSKGRKPTTPNLPKRSQRISTPFKKKERAGGVKRKNRHSQAKHRGGGSHNRHQTLPKSMSNPTWLNSCIQTKW